ncbi:hypothetical protein JCM11491_004166 [Sporobolomyces phaffii]
MKLPDYLDRLDNIYRTPPDFGTLAFDVPDRIKNPAGSWTIDWKNDEAVRSLTKALLKRDFDLEVALPSDRLCPTVPSRLEYCLWVLKLALLTAPRQGATPRARRFIGVDIGTGASCIYPLLLHRLIQRLELPSNHPCVSALATSEVDFKLLATEIDSDSFKVAAENVRKNSCRDRIQVCKVESSNGHVCEPELIGKPLLTRELRDGEVLKRINRIDFVMCNPPFYSSAQEMEQSAREKDLEPFAVCTAASNELITDGGEVEFIKRMMKESLDIGANKVRWFTSLIGKFSSIGPLVEQLREYEIHNYHIHLLANAGKTRRWILTWSLQAERVPSVLCSSSLSGNGNTHVASTLRSLLPRSSGTHSSRTIRVTLNPTNGLSTTPSTLTGDASGSAAGSTGTTRGSPLCLGSLVRSIAETTFAGLGDAVTVSIGVDDRGPSPPVPPPGTGSLASTSASASASVWVSLVAQKDSWSRSARRGHVDGDARGTQRTARGASGDTFVHNASRDALVERERDEAPLVAAEFRIDGSFVAEGLSTPSDGSSDRSDDEDSIKEIEFHLEGEWTRGYDSRGS